MSPITTDRCGRSMAAVATAGMAILIWLGYSTAEGPTDRSTTAFAQFAPVNAAERESEDQARDTGGVDRDQVSAMLRRLLPDIDNEHVEWLAEQYGETARDVAQRHGRDGVAVLLALGEQGVDVRRDHPKIFRELVNRLGDDALATFLVFMKDHFRNIIVKKRPDNKESYRGGVLPFLREIGSLPPEAKSMAAKHPQMLPFLLLAPEDAVMALKAEPTLCLKCFPSISLEGEEGADSIGQVARMVLERGPKARRWIEARGLDGLFLADKFPKYVDRKPPMDLPVFLEILSHNQEDIAALVERGQGDQLWGALDILVEKDGSLDLQTPEAREPGRGAWLALACDDEHTVRFLVEHGNTGVRVLNEVWGDTFATGVTLPSLLYDSYGRPDDDPSLLKNAWAALVPPEGNPRLAFRTLLFMASHWGNEQLSEVPKRSQRFRVLLTTLDHKVVAYLAQAEANPRNAEDRYRILEQRGFSELNRTPQGFLAGLVPLRDVVHLGWVLAKGYTPTKSELLWAGIDAVFTVWDIGTLGGGKVVSAPIKGGSKEAGRELAKVAEKAVAEALEGAARQAAQQTAEQLTAVMVTRFSRSPQVVRQIAQKGLYNDLSVTWVKARKSSVLLKIPIVHLSYALAKWELKERPRDLIEMVDLPTDKITRLTYDKTIEVINHLRLKAQKANRW